MGAPPLVVITTNEERTLPAAFLRRCWVYHMEPGADFGAWLMPRGRAHFDDPAQISDEVLRTAAEQLVKDRRVLLGRQLTPPGQAEYIDLLGALAELGPTEQQKGEPLEAAQLRLLERIGRYVLQKHPATESSRR